jgi:para-aminobenzoate synthetase
VRYHSLVIDAISMPEDLIPTAWTVVSDSNYVSSFKGAPSAGSFLESSAWSCNFLRGNSSTLDGLWMQSHLGEDQGMVMHNEDGSLVWRRQGSLPDLVVGNVFDGSNNQSWLTELPSVPYVKKEGALLMALSHRHRPHHAVQFHPESVATAYGRQILENFSKITQEYWQQQPWQPAKEVAMKNSKQEVPAAQTYLGNDKNKDFSAAVPNVAGINMQSADDTVELSVNGVGQSTSAAPNIALRIHSQKLSGFAVKAENIFCELFGSGAAEDTFWLDSSTRDQA